MNAKEFNRLMYPAFLFSEEKISGFSCQKKYLALFLIYSDFIKQNCGSL